MDINTINYEWLIKKLKTESNKDLDIYRNIRVFLNLPTNISMFSDEYHHDVLKIIEMVYELSPQVKNMNKTKIKIKINWRYEQ